MAEEYVCSKCGKKFNSNRGLKIHMARVHGIKSSNNTTTSDKKE